MSSYDLVIGNPLDKAVPHRIYGDTQSVANDPLLHRVNLPNARMPVLCHVEGEGVYLEDVNNPIEGFDFPTDEAEVEAGATTEVNIINLTDTRVVAVFKDGADNKLKARAGIVTKTSGAVSWGTAVTINGADTDSASVCRLSDTWFAVSYMDDGGDDYLCARIGVVTTSDNSITMKTEKEMNSAAISDLGTSICTPRSGMIAISYVLAGDSKGYVIASTYNTTTGVIANPGTAVEIDSSDAVKYPAITSHDTGDIAVAFQNDSNANDRIEIIGGTVAADKTVVMDEAHTAAVNGASGAATSIDITSLGADKVALCWIDNNKPHVAVATISDTTPTVGTELELESGAALTLRIDSNLSDTIVAVCEDDAHSNDVGNIYMLSVSGTTITKSSTSQFTIASTANTDVCALSPNIAVILFADAGDSNKGKVITGIYKKNLVDVRSSVASASFVLYAFPWLGRKRIDGRIS